MNKCQACGSDNLKLLMKGENQPTMWGCPKCGMLYAMLMVPIMLAITKEMLHWNDAVLAPATEKDMKAAIAAADKFRKDATGLQ